MGHGFHRLAVVLSGCDSMGVSGLNEEYSIKHVYNSICTYIYIYTYIGVYIYIYVYTHIYVPINEMIPFCP